MNKFSDHLPDQQKIEAVDNLFSMYGKEAPRTLKMFLFKIQGGFLIDPDNMGYPPIDACNAMDAIFNLLEGLEPKEKGGNNE